MKKNLLVLTFVLSTVFASGQKLPFQGKLIESGTVVDGTRTFAFEISSVGWSETHNDVPVTDGLYFIVLGTINPLPDSLFYGVTEQNMNITVSGTPLSPVILFKPLSSPFEGGELVVKNDEGTVVGSMHAKADSATKNGELILSGTSGNPNVSLGASGATGDQGAILIHDSVGTVKAELWSADVNGRFRLYGENTGKLNMGFGKPWDPNGGETLRDLPSVSLEVDGLYYSNTYVVQNDTAIRGRFYLSSNVGEFNMIRTDGHFMYKDNVLMSQYRIQNWGGTGFSGYFDLRGPSSRNIEMGSKQWVNADLPWFKLMGSQNQDVIQMSASEDSTESAYINLLSQDEKEASLYTTGIRFNTTGDNGRELISLNNEDRDGHGYAGYFNLSGPNSSNIFMGTRHWEGDPDIPLINLHGRNDFHAMELSIGLSDSTNQYGMINIHTTDGQNWANINPTHIGVKNVSLTSQNNNNTGWGGKVDVMGPASTNVHIGSRDWNDANLPVLNLNGKDDFHAIELTVSEDSIQYGIINLWSQDGKSLSLSPNGFGVEGVEMSTSVHPNGNFGSLRIAGPNTTNFEFNPGWWDQPDRATMNMNGNTDENRISISVVDDHRGEEVGEIFTRSGDNKVGKMGPIEFSLINNENDLWNNLASMHINGDGGNGWAGYLDLRGPSSTNISMGTRDWEGTPDLPIINLHGENDFHAMELSASSDGNGTQEGWLNIHSSSGRNADLNPNILVLHSTAGNQTIAMETRDHGQGEHGHFHLNGVTTTNIESGAHENPDRPHLNMNGETDENRITFIVENDDRGVEVGRSYTYSADEKLTRVEPTNITLFDATGGNWNGLASMGMNNDNGNGWKGTFSLRGPSSTNFEFMPGWWDQPDRARLQLNGNTNEGRMNIGVTDDGQGNEHGEIYIHSSVGPESYLSSNTVHLRKADGSHLVGLHLEDVGNGMLQGNVSVDSEDGRSLNLTPDGFNTNKTSIGNVNSGFGTNSELFLNGANSPNIQMGGQHWENSDLGFFHVFTDKSDGNGWYFQGATIAANTDGNDSWGNLDVFNNGVSNISLDGNSGDINIAGTLNQNSDRRLKKDIVKLSSSLDNLSRLQGVSYYWKSDTLNAKPQIGLIAQDVEKVYPELVVTKDDGFKALNYSQMVAVLIEAVKELNARVEKLETENIQLKAELSASATNTSEIEQLKEQMQTLVKMVQLQYSEDTNEDFTSTPGLK